MARLPLWWLALPALLAGCLFPYRVIYRPDVAGVVEDDAGRPVAGVNVLACSASHFANLEREGCAFSAATITNAEGRFAFERARAWEWFDLLPHEGPLPFTLVSACAPDGRVGGVKLDPAYVGPPLHIPLARSDTLSLIAAGPQFAGPRDAAAEVRRACRPPPPR